ncbi:DUF983 domain-containing protein [Falsiroseomonas selenitidurans]|uniref:DUF983 domain-containing protein n=1 Tax=Falsiroseomonas selenitidurans TaxID=2716335 RepID=A0ABX1E9E0_9PROT|nr:DUF983 domain-containing protein [Falsiroseomonas selenitidurans]NKC33656.1 DUF983 domain-containing protein [Falsiroseomonas selenitidurans]
MTRWEPARPAATAEAPATSFWTALSRGARNRCPVCGQGKVFAGYLRVAEECTVCHAPLGRLRADDAPPYFTIFIAGHLLFPPVLWVEKAWMPPMWLHMVVWLPAFTIACILLLRPIKGATVGWLARLGFDGTEHDGDPLPARPPRSDHAG